MNNNYKIVRTIFENVFQRVLECTDNDTSDMFYSNVITSPKVINLINIEELKNIPSNILECYNTEDRIYIFTKPLKTEFKGIRDASTNSLTLKQQFNLSEEVIKLAQSIFNMTDVVQQKILDLDRLYMDENKGIIVDCNLIFEQEYDIADNETFKRLGNMIHFIFSGNEIIDYNISDNIPPDILKIIVRCLTREYTFPNDVLSELKSSPIYAMIFDTEVSSIEKTNKVRQSNEHIANDVSNENILESKASNEKDDSIFDIYLNDNNANEKFEKTKAGIIKHKEILRAVASIFIVVMVLLIGNSIIKYLHKGKDVSAINMDTNQTNTEIDANKETNTEEIDKPVTTITDSTGMYFNDMLLAKVGYEGTKAEIDGDIYVEGINSLAVSNVGEGKTKSLFAVVDFTDEKFSYMLKKQIGIAAKVKSEKDVKASIVLEAYKDGTLASNFHTSINVYDDIWSQVTVPINVTDADSLNVYIEYEGDNKVWIDSIYIDVIK
ncbi:MAG: hypothetical protein ACERLG_08985 [Sedimentibacter sp.]